MRKSLKRIIWALGWYFVWCCNDFTLYYSGKDTTILDSIVMFLIWIIPLFVFEDDEKLKEKNEMSEL